MNRQMKHNNIPAYQELGKDGKMEERSLRVVGTDKTFFNKLTNFFYKIKRSIAKATPSSSLEAVI